MKRLNNPEFRKIIQNLLCAEEHTADSLNINNKKTLEFLVKLKNKRNSILNFPEEKDRDRWCVIKHLLLANYHCLEIINSKYYNDNIVTLNKDIEKLIDDAINDFEISCNNCKDDLLLFKILKGDKK